MPRGDGTGPPGVAVLVGEEPLVWEDPGEEE